MTIRLLACLFVVLLCNSTVLDADEFMIRDGDTVGFLGDSITAARTYGKHIEKYTLLRYPDRNVRFINLGIGGDTAAGGLERLERDVFDQNVTLLTVAYGINDIGWGTKADDEHRQLYLDSIRGIVTQCLERGVRVVICSAAATARDPDESENDFLQQMCEEGMAIAREEGAKSIHVLKIMRNLQRRMRTVNESLPKDKQQSFHVADGVHLNDLGQLAMAYAILKGLGAPAVVSTCAVDAEAESIIEASGCEVSGIVCDDDSVAFTRLDEGLPFNDGLFATLSYGYVPMNEYSRYEVAVRHLKPGKYQLQISGRLIGTWRSGQLAEGIDIASTTPDAWQPGGPWDAQAGVLKSLTEARDEIDQAARSLRANLSDSPLLETFAEEAEEANEQLEQMQRLVSKPRHYQFVLTRVADETTLTSPLEYQVFQRKSRNEGSIVVSGATLREADEVQVRFRGRPLRGELPSGWQTIDVDPQDGTFNETLSFPAGGWFAMDLKVVHERRTVEERSVERFGVGEVFVGAGQSNSTNAGEFKTRQTSGMVASFSGEYWQLADDPQPGVADRSQGGSYYPAFGDAMSEAYQVPIGIAATGFGGTSVNAWLPKDEGMFQWMMTRINQLGPHGFRAVLWHQGESDIEMSTEEYYDKLKRVIETSRTEAGWEIPWVVAQVSYHNPDKPSFDTTRSAQARLWADGIALQGPDTDTLTGDHRDHEGKGIHFSPKGLHAHGLMWFNKVRPVLETSLEATP